jgi:hypothetical protein
MDVNVSEGFDDNLLKRKDLFTILLNLNVTENEK